MTTKYHPWRTKNMQLIGKKARPKEPEQWTVEYSTVQKCYHVDTLGRTLRNNLIAVFKGINNGYLLIGIFPTQSKANAFVDYHREHANPNGYCIGEDGITVKNLNAI